MARKDIDNTLSSVAPYSSRVSMPIPYVRHKFDILVLEQVNFCDCLILYGFTPPFDFKYRIYSRLCSKGACCNLL